MYEKHFPDPLFWVLYQIKQEFHYHRALKKIRLYKLHINLPAFIRRFPDLATLLTAEEKEDVNYYHGKKEFAKYQNVNYEYNRYDTRKRFLLKMIKNKDM
jgi:hypothetical protein